MVSGTNCGDWADGPGRLAAITTPFAVQDPSCEPASTAVHVKGVVRTGTGAPETGEQEADTGVTPPTTVGVRVTAIGLPSSDVNTGDGHVMVGPVDVGTRPDTSEEGGPIALALSYDCTAK